MEYSKAKYCINGHLISDDLEISANTDNVCRLCGVRCISECPSCNAPIYGYALSASIACYKAELPAFCQHCGSPYPWTQSLIESYDGILALIEQVSPELSGKLKESFPDITTHTPKTELASIYLENALQRLSGFSRTLLIEWIQNHAVSIIPKLLSHIIPGN